MCCRSVDPDFIRLLVCHELYQCSRDVLVPSLHQKPLRVPPPEHVVALEGRNELLGCGTGQAFAWIVLLTLRVRRFFTRSVKSAFLGNNPVNPPMLLIPQFAFIRRAAAGTEARRSRVMLDDVVVPVEDPDVPVGANLGHDRGG